MAVYNYNFEERNEWITRLEEQKESIQQELFEGETIKHCLDTESFDGAFYNPQWVITSEARVWSLARNNNHGGWNTPYPNDNDRRWYMKNDWHETKDRLGLNSEKRVFYHQAVANYFCDKKAIELFGEENCIPHHLFRYHHLLDDHIVQTRQEDCTWNNRAKHLRWVTKYDHAVLNYIQDALNRRDSIDTTIDKMMSGIPYTDTETGEKKFIIFQGDKNELRQQYGEILENGKFYRTVGNENEDQWTALWYEYNGGNDRRLSVMGFFTPEGQLPYMK